MTVQKPEGKIFSCYAIIAGPHAGVYSTWEEIRILVLNSDKITPYKGYYSLEEAFTAVRASVGPNDFIIILLKGKKFHFNSSTNNL